MMKMQRQLAVGLGALVLAAGACAQEEELGHGRRAAAPTKPDWEFGATVYPTQVRGGENYTSGIVVADRGSLHWKPASTTNRSAHVRPSSAGPFPAARP